MIVVNPTNGDLQWIPPSVGGGGGAVASVAGLTGVIGASPLKIALSLGNVDNTSDANKPISVATAAALTNKADLVAGVIPTAQIPAIAISTKLASVGSQAAMLALSGQEGDWTIRTDLGTTWIITGADPTQLTNWTALSYPTAPVNSVNGQTGVVVLTASDVGAQPSDSDLTAIAALTTNSFGRGLLALSSDTAVRSYIGAGTSSFNGLFTGLDFTSSNLTSIATRKITDLQGQLSYASDVIDYTFAFDTPGASLYSSINHSGSGTYVRQSSSWLTDTAWHSGLDVTPIAVYNSAATHFGVTLISPRHFLLSKINKLANGTTVRFVKSDNTVVSRTISSSVDIAGTDVSVGLLNSDVPAGIGFCKVLPSSIEPTQLGRAVGYITTDDQKVYAADLASINASTGLMGVAQSIYPKRAPFWKSVGWAATAHEGLPYFFVLDKSIVLLGILNEDHDTVWSIAFYHSAINAAMTTLGGGYQLTDYTPTILPPRVPTPAGIPLGIIALDSSGVPSVDVGARTLNDVSGNPILLWGENPNRVELLDTASFYIGNDRVLVGDALDDHIGGFGFSYNADNLGSLTNVATARTNLGATTVGSNLFTVANPGAVRYIRIDASNGITLRTAVQQLGDLGGEPALGNPGADGYLLSSTTSGVRSWISPPSGGDASTNTSVSVDSELAVFSGTLGKTIKRATGSGIVKLTSGVLGFGATTSDLSEGTNLYYTDARVRLNRLDQLAAPTASVSFGSQRLTNVADPSGAQDAATKNYVDLAIAGLRKMSVRAATTAAGTLASSFENGDSAGGVTLATGDYILIKDQATQAENGIYVVNASGAPTRATYADSAAEIDGLMVVVEDGTNAGTIWISTSDVTTLGTDAITFTQFNKATDLIAGAALTASGLTWDVAVDGSTIEVSADALRVKDAGITLAKMANLAANSIIGNNTGSAATPIALTASQVKTLLSLNNVENTALSTWAGSANITTLGTITTGTWQGAAIAAAYLPGSFSGFANPSALIGMSANNGSATTAMRSDGTPAIDPAIAPIWTGLHTFKYSDSATSTVTDLTTFAHNSSGTPAASFGGAMLYNLKSSTTADQNAMRLSWFWTVATHASRTSAYAVGLVNNAGALTNLWYVYGSGGASLNSNTDPGAGILNVNTGFRIGNAATLKNVLRGDGTNFVSAQLAVADLSDTKTGSGNIVLATSPTLTTPVLGVATMTSINKVAITAPTTAATLAFATDNATITFQGTDTYVGRATTDTLTNKRITKRTGTTTSSATPTINTDNVDFYSITALAAAITSFTTNLSGTPTENQTLWIAITDNGTARAITWGTSFEASTVPLPTTTVISTRLDVGFAWNTVTSKWRCVAVA